MSSFQKERNSGGAGKLGLKLLQNSSFVKKLLREAKTIFFKLVFLVEHLRKLMFVAIP